MPSLGIGLRLAAARHVGIIAPPWSPEALFASGEKGSFYEPRLGVNLFQDEAGATPITASGQTIGRIASLVNGVSLTQATGAAKPAFLQGSGLSWVDFDGFDDSFIMAGAELDAVRNVQGFTVAVAFQSDVTLSGGNIYRQSNGISTASDRAVLRTSSSSATYVFGGRRLDADGLVTISGTLTTAKAVILGTMDYANSDIFLEINGTQVASNTVFQTAGSSSDTASLSGSMGSRGTSFNDGRFFSMVAIGRVLTAGEKTSLRGYLNGKAGI